MVAAHPNIPPLDVMKEVGRLWQAITKEKLQRFQVQASEDQARYDREFTQYQSELRVRQGIAGQERQTREVRQPTKMHQQDGSYCLNLKLRNSLNPNGIMVGSDENSE